MSRITLIIISTVLALAQSACSDVDENIKRYDFGGPDLGQQQEGGVNEAGADAALEGVADGPVADTTPTPDQAVTSDGPVNACNAALDLKPLTLDPAYCVVYRFSLSAAPDAINLDGDKLLTYTLNKTTDPFTGLVQQYVIDAASGKPGVATPYFSFKAATTDPAAKVYAGEFLPLSSTGFVAVTYTDSTFKGELAWGDKGIKTPKIVDKVSAWDAVFLDGKTLLLNSKDVGALSGQGVYVVQDGVAPWLLIKDLGVASGSMALGQSVLFAGGGFGATFESRIYGFTLAEIKAAVAAKTTLSGTTDGDLIYKASFIPGVTALGDSLLAGQPNAAYAFKTIERIPVSVSGSKVIAGAAKTVITPPTSGANVARIVGSLGQRLGLLLSGTGKPEIAVVEEK